MLNLGPFKTFLLISYIGNNENPPITDEICWSLHVRYCEVPLYLLFCNKRNAETYSEGNQNKHDRQFLAVNSQNVNNSNLLTSVEASRRFFGALLRCSSEASRSRESQAKDASPRSLFPRLCPLSSSTLVKRALSVDGESLESVRRSLAPVSPPPPLPPSSPPPPPPPTLSGVDAAADSPIGRRLTADAASGVQAATVPLLGLLLPLLRLLLPLLPILRPLLLLLSLLLPLLSLLLLPLLLPGVSGKGRRRRWRAPGRRASPEDAIFRHQWRMRGGEISESSFAMLIHF